MGNKTAKIGFTARQFGDFKQSYEEEISFAKRAGFDFIQLWYDAKKGLEVTTEKDKVKAVKQANFPVIIHAVLSVDEIKTEITPLNQILDNLGLDELIIHPSSGGDLEPLRTLIENAVFAIEVLDGKKLFIENNSKLDHFLVNPAEIKHLFESCPQAELLLDIAHMQSYKALQEIVRIKKPGILHVADRHLEIVHEHLPIGAGNIDFGKVFTEVLPNFEGRLILEVTYPDGSLVYSKEKVEEILK